MKQTKLTALFVWSVKILFVFYSSLFSEKALLSIRKTGLRSLVVNGKKKYTKAQTIVVVVLVLTVHSLPHISRGHRY